MKFPFPIIATWILSIVGLSAAKPLNILFFTADDMNYNSTAVFGGPIKDLTPNVDHLASEGLRFEHAYSTVAVCQPVRQTMFCGLYPHRSGSMGKDLLSMMQRTEDPFADAFAHRDNKDLVPAVIEKMKQQYQGKKD